MPLFLLLKEQRFAAGWLWGIRGVALPRVLVLFLLWERCVSRGKLWHSELALPRRARHTGIARQQFTRSTGCHGTSSNVIDGSQQRETGVAGTDHPQFRPLLGNADKHRHFHGATFTLRLNVDTLIATVTSRSGSYLQPGFIAQAF